MKIGLITFNNTINYGASLQAFALQEFLEKNGFDTEYINYKNAFIESQESIGANRGILKSILRFFIMRKGLKRKKNKFKEFEEKYINLSKRYDGFSIKEANLLYDVFIVGSDQVWNGNITGNDTNYFLSFVDDDKRKISYASSFGNNPEILDKEEILKNLKRFFAISVREKSGCKLLDLFSINSTLVCDPTFLLSSIEWNEKFKFHRMIKGDYILCYFVNDKKKVFDFIKKLKKRTGLPVIYISISPRPQFGTKTVYDYSPVEFMTMIYYAKYVVTGSFHGTAFSINFNKQFYCENCSQNSRVGNILEMFGLNDRMISNEQFDECIDYNRVNKIIEEQRKKSQKWIVNALIDKGGELWR